MEFFEHIRQGNAAAVKEMLEKDPALANEKDEKGFPAIVLATYYQQPAITEILLEHGADVDARDAVENTPLMGVSFKGDLELARMLLSHGANVNAQNATGATALIYAATFGHTELTRTLIENGADPSMKDRTGSTAYAHARAKNLSEIMAILEDNKV